MSEFEPTQYYDAHCTKCGESTKADKLAFDFGELINKAVSKAVERPLGPDLKWEPLLGLDLRLYYTWRDLVYLYKLKADGYHPFRFTVGMLRKQLKRFAKVEFSQLVGKDIDTMEYYNLVQHIRFTNQQGQDVDIRGLANRIKEIVDLCSPQMSPDENEVIAQFQVSVGMVEDDRGNKFAKKLEIEYEDRRRQTVRHNVCPNCGKKFYPEVGKHEEIIVGMAGSARVGKTAYLAALVDCLMKSQNGIARVVEAKNKEWEFFKSAILLKYRAGEKIDKTPFEGGGETIPLFSIEIAVLERSYIFTFIDMPGEVFDNPEDTEEDAGMDFINNERRILNYAQMIWFCVAPEQIDADIARIRKITNLKQDEVNTKTADVMANIRATMDAVHLHEKMPAAILVTMSDQIIGENAADGLFAPDVDVCREFIDGGCLNYQKTDDFCCRSKRYLDNAGEIVTAINHIFDRYSVFAVAAYGRNLPQGTQEELDLLEINDRKDDLWNDRSDFKPIPSMVELPFFWTLAALGKIQELKQVQRYETQGFGPWKKEVYVGDESVPVAEYEMFQQINEE